MSDSRRGFLSRLTIGNTLATNDTFYVRTEYPDQLTTRGDDWRIRIGGLATEGELTLADLRPLVEDMGEVMLECAGNTERGNFGLMSAASWAGVPFAAVVDLLEIDDGATAVVVSGFDDHSVPSDGDHSDAARGDAGTGGEVAGGRGGPLPRAGPHLGRGGSDGATPVSGG